MSRRRNASYREALLSAATRVIADEGLGVATATIAKQAGVSAGTLFNYFQSKSVLVNELYVSLKCEMGAAAAEGLPACTRPHDQLRHVWDRWVDWATSAPEKRRALAHLDVSEDITDESRQAAHQAFYGMAELLERCRANGPMQDVPLDFVLRILNGIADVTIDDLIARPGPGSATNDPRSMAAFDAIWRAVAC